MKIIFSSKGYIGLFLAAVGILIGCHVEHTDSTGATDARVDMSSGHSVASKQHPNTVDERGISPLLDAVNANDVARVKELLDSGAQPDLPGVARSLLVSAIHRIQDGRFVCATDIIRLLLDHGADPNKPDPRIGSYPLQDALEVGDMACAQLLREKGAKLEPNGGDSYKLMVSAVKGVVLTGNVKLVDLVIGWGVDPNASDPKTGFYSLSQAVWNDNLKVAQALIDRGVNPCLRESDGRTPLDIAKSFKVSLELIRFLESVTHCGEK
jgi:ankyrin repeat protein